MSIALNIISLLGGLAMFLYGMRLMSGSLKEGQSGTLKVAMEKVTNNPFKAFLLGIAVTAIIQSSTATIVITSGLVAAGVISLNQSLGIIIGANVGTTVTGQIIRLLDVNAEAGSFLEFLKPSTLAPLALVIGITLIMFCKFEKSDNIGNIAIGFGILFSGLMSMTNVANSLTETGILDRIFEGMGRNPLIGYASGAGVAFGLQSSSATIGILQAFSMSSDITFSTVYVVLVGIYLGDCVTTAIVCSIGAKSDAKRVGIVNIIFNLSETVLVFIVVTILHKLGLLDKLWNMPMSSGDIANTNTVFNLGCAILLFPCAKLYGKLSRILVKDEQQADDKYGDLITALNPVFFATPALAFRGCYTILNKMFELSCRNITDAFDVLCEYNEETVKKINETEDDVDRLTDAVSNYLVQLSPHVKEDLHVHIQDQYYKVITEFERLSDYAVNISECAQRLHADGIEFSDYAKGELVIIRDLLNNIFTYTDKAFRKRNVEAAQHIEPLEEVMDDMISTLSDNHVARLREGKCTINAGTVFLDALTNIERISDTCSNVGIATIARANPEIGNLAHNYITALHQGQDAEYNEEYSNAHEEYFARLQLVMDSEALIGGGHEL